MSGPRYRPDGLLRKRVAARILRPHLGHLGQVVAAGWQHGWVDLAALPQVRSRLTSRTRASSVNDVMVSEAKRLFAGIPGVDLVTDQGQLVVMFANDDLRIAFHRIRLGLVPDPRSGRQEEIWHQHSATLGQGVLPGTAGTGTWADCGYVLDRSENRLIGAHVRASYLGAEAWIIDIPLPISAMGTEPNPIVTSGPPAPHISSAAQKLPREDTGSDS